MAENWFPAAMLLVTLPLGCSSRVEVEYDAEEMRTAAYTGDGGHTAESKASTRLRLVAERKISSPPPAVPTEPPPTAASPAPTEVRYVPVPTAAPVVTSIQIGDIDIRVGDLTHIHGATHATDDSPEKSEPRLRRHADEWRSPRDADAPTPHADERCDRMMREHEARVRRWEALFAR